MARDFFVNGPCMVSVKGNSATLMPSLTQLGLSDGPIRPSPEFKHRDMNLDAWGGVQGEPGDVQWMLGAVNIGMTLIHFDRVVLAACIAEAMGGLGEGIMERAGVRLGGGKPRFDPANHYIGLNLTSPDGGLPWRFYFAYLSQMPFEFPLGTEKSVVTLNWRCIPYDNDYYNAGAGAKGKVLWDHSLDS